MFNQIQAYRLRHLRSLTVSLAVAFLTLSLAVLLIASSMETYFSIKTQRRVVANQLQLIAQDAANTVGGFIQEKFQAL